MPEAGADFLKKKYDLHNSPEVLSAARRTEIKTGRRVLQSPEPRIQNYLARFKEIVDEKDEDKKKENIQALKRVLLPKFVTKFKDIPDSYWKLQERILRERGQQGDYDRFSDEEKNKAKHEIADGLLSDQQSSLEQWIDYLASDDSSYIPDHIKYWTFRSVIGLAEYDKDKKEFPERSKGTVKMFPDINQEALSTMIDWFLKNQKGEPVTLEGYERDLTDEQKNQARQFISQENFAKLYGFVNELIRPIPEHLIPITKGKWVKYEQGSDHTPLVQSIRGRGTGWCTAGENTAKTQLGGGDFHVFYSNDDDDNPTIPRIAIRMEGEKIAEVRGIAAKQNLDPYMTEILEKKLDEFPDKDKYLKKEHDMRQLTEIDKKVKRGEALGKDELVFLYEVDSKIQGFGYQSDPRINELRTGRDMHEDMLTIFDCTEDQIAHATDQMNENTKAYVGKLTPGIFDQIQKYNIEHVFTSFPEGRIRLESLTIGGKSVKELQEEMRSENINISGYVRDMLESPDFVTQQNKEDIDLVRLKVGDLGLGGSPTTDQLYEKAKELGLDLCPAEVGPQMRLTYKDQPLYEYFNIGMKQIADSDGCPDVFTLDHGDDGLWLSDYWARPEDGWAPVDEFVFRLRPSGSEASKSPLKFWPFRHS